MLDYILKININFLYIVVLSAIILVLRLFKLYYPKESNIKNLLSNENNINDNELINKYIPTNTDYETNIIKESIKVNTNKDNENYTKFSNKTVPKLKKQETINVLMNNYLKDNHEDQINQTSSNKYLNESCFNYLNKALNNNIKDNLNLMLDNDLTSNKLINKSCSNSETLSNDKEITKNEDSNSLIYIESKANNFKLKVQTTISQIRIETINYVYSQFKIIFILFVLFFCLTITIHIFFRCFSLLDILIGMILFLLGILFSFSVSTICLNLSCGYIKLLIKSIDDLNYDINSLKKNYSSLFYNYEYNLKYNYYFLSAICTDATLIILVLTNLSFFIIYFFISKMPENIVSNKYELLCFYGLGSTFSAFFARISGGIFTKGADISCDLICKDFIEDNFKENNKTSPISLADNIGDLIGDLNGSILDLLCSITEGMSAFMIIIVTSFDNISLANLIINHMFCLITTSIFIFLLLEIFIQYNNNIINKNEFNKTYESKVLNDYKLGIKENNNTIKTTKPYVSHNEKDKFINLNISRANSKKLSQKLVFTSNFSNQDFDVFEIEKDLLNRLKYQLVIMVIIIVLYIILFLPKFTNYNSIKLQNFNKFPTLFYYPTKTELMINILNGIILGYLMCYLTFYYTSQYYSTVKQITIFASISSGINIIYGLASGYFSVIFPMIVISLSIFVTHLLSGIIGLAFVVVGLCLILPVIIQYQFFGPISDVCLGLSNMVLEDNEVIEQINRLDVAGNTVSAMVKGYSTGSAGIISFTLFCSIMIKSKIYVVNLYDISSIVFIMLGTLFCCLIYSLVMKATSINAQQLIIDSKNQIYKIRKLEEYQSKFIKPDYFEFIQSSAEYSLKKAMEIAFISFIFTIILFIFSNNNILPILTGLIITGIPISISSSNSGSAWDNSKKAIQHMFDTYYLDNKIESLNIQKSNSLNNAYISDNIGDALKDIAGPAITILIKYISFLCLIIVNLLA